MKSMLLIPKPNLDLHLSILNVFVSSTIYDMANFTFMDGDVPRSTSNGNYISQLSRFPRASSNETDFNARNKLLIGILLHQCYRNHTLRFFSKFYRRHYELVSNFKVGLKSPLQQGPWEQEFYGDLVYKLRK